MCGEYPLQGARKQQESQLLQFLLEQIKNQQNPLVVLQFQK